MKGLDTSENLKELYERVAPQFDPGGFRLYFAAKEVTGIKRLWEEFPYEDACGRFEEADGHELVRYLTAAYFKAVTWEIVPGTTYERAVLREMDTSAPEYRAFEKQIYETALERMGFQKLLSRQPDRARTANTSRKKTANEVMHDRSYDHGNQQGNLLGSDPRGKRQVRAGYECYGA